MLIAVSSHINKSGEQVLPLDVVMISILCIIVLTGIGCDESLPVYEAPKTLFESTLLPEYHWTRAGGEFWVSLNVKNIFDETFQLPGQPKGTLEIILKREPHYRKTVTIDENNLITTGVYNSFAHTMTINSDQTLSLLYKWYFVDDSEVFLPYSVFTPKGGGQGNAMPEVFIIKGSIQIFDTIGQVLFQPIEYTLNYYY
jgi:hypothetical protein